MGFVHFGVQLQLYSDSFCFSFTDLLAPHGIIQSFFIQQAFMSACFNYITFFQYIDPVGMHDGGKPVCNQNGDLVPFSEISRMVSVISSSVNESSAEVASSNNSNFGLRSNARAIDKRCFSPPDNFKPPSPIMVSNPFSALANKFWQAALFKCIHQFFFSGRWIYKQQVFFNGAAEKIGILCYKTDLVAQVIKAYFCFI